MLCPVLADRMTTITLPFSLSVCRTTDSVVAVFPYVSLRPILMGPIRICRRRQIGGDVKGSAACSGWGPTTGGGLSYGWNDGVEKTRYSVDNLSGRTRLPVVQMTSRFIGLSTRGVGVALGLAIASGLIRRR